MIPVWPITVLMAEKNGHGGILVPVHNDGRLEDIPDPSEEDKQLLLHGIKQQRMSCIQQLIDLEHAEIAVKRIVTSN